MARVFLGLVAAIAFGLGWILGRPVRVAVAPPAETRDFGRASATGGGQAFRRPVQELAERLGLKGARPGERGEIAARLCAITTEFSGEDFREAIGALGAAYSSWGGADPAALLAGLWAERDLAGARAWALGVRGNPRLVGAVFETWAQMDAPAFFLWTEQHAAEVGAGAAGALLPEIVARVASQADPERGLRLLAELSGRPGELGAGAGLYARWTELQPPAAAARALLETKGGRRAKALKAVAASWVLGQPEEARAWVQKNATPLLAERALSEAGEELGRHDPVRGLAFLAALPATDEILWSVPTVVSEWLARDPAAALQWIAAEPRPELQAAGRQGLARFEHLNRFPLSKALRAAALGFDPDEEKGPR